MSDLERMGLIHASNLSPEDELAKFGLLPVHDDSADESMPRIM